MANDESREFSQARTAAFRLLKVRERSMQELRERLARKKISRPVIDLTVEYLLDKRFLNDESFARNWIRYRQARPFGPQRIKMELRQKGIADEIIDREINLAFGQNDQQEVVLDLARRRALRYSSDVAEKRKKKVFDFLVRRGFGLDLIKKAIREI